MNDNKLLLDQVVLKKEVGEDGTINFKALAYSIVEHRAINMTTKVLDDKTIVMTPSVDGTVPVGIAHGMDGLGNEDAFTMKLPLLFDTMSPDETDEPEHSDPLQ